jgi:branched-chain amino acid aminotransferase
MSQILNSYYLYNNEIISTADLKYLEYSQSKTVVYEVIRIIDGKPLFFEDHISRFFQSLKEYNLENTITPIKIASKIKQLIAKNGVNIGNIKFYFSITPKKAPVFFAYYIPHSYPNINDYLNGVKLTTLIADRANPLIKAEQKELRLITQELLKNKEFYEVLLIHPQGFITEGSKSNFFMIKENILYTSLSTDVLEGVTSKQILNLCKKNKIQVVQQRTQANELANFDAVFISGTSPKILPVNSINTITYSVNNELLKFLMKELDFLIENYLNTH